MKTLFLFFILSTGLITAGDNVLHQAILQGNLVEAEAMINNDPSLCVELNDQNKHVLEVALELGFEDLAVLIAEQHPHPRRIITYSYLFPYKYQTLLYFALKANNAKVVRALIARDVRFERIYYYKENIDAQCDLFHAVKYAAFHNDDEILALLLKKQMLTRNLVDNLDEEIDLKDVQIYRCFETKDVIQSALFHAVNDLDIDAVEALLKCGADPHDHKNGAALEPLGPFNPITCNFNALQTALNNNSKVIAQLLLQYGFDPATALELAVKKGNYKEIEFVLNNVPQDVFDNTSALIACITANNLDLFKAINNSSRTYTDNHEKLLRATLLERKLSFIEYVFENLGYCWQEALDFALVPYECYCSGNAIDNSPVIKKLLSYGYRHFDQGKLSFLVNRNHPNVLELLHQYNLLDDRILKCALELASTDANQICKVVNLLENGYKISPYYQPLHFSYAYPGIDLFKAIIVTIGITQEEFDTLYSSRFMYDLKRYMNANKKLILSFPVKR